MKDTPNLRKNPGLVAILLERKLDTFIQYYNHNRIHQSLDGNAPNKVSGGHQPLHAQLGKYSWVSHCNGLFFRPRLLHEQEFATHR